LDQHNGKVTYPYHAADTTRVGSLINYTVTSQRTRVSIQSVELMELPLALAHNHLLFFHQVLELCYYCIPLGSVAPDIFALVTQLYTIASELLTSLFKKFFLIKICALLGIYPEELEFRPFVHYALAVPVEYIQNVEFDERTESAFDDWLERCVMIHPYSERFKTITLLYRNRPL